MINDFLLKPIPFSFLFLFVLNFNASGQLLEKVDSLIAIHDTISDKNERVIAICKSAQRGIGKNMELSIKVAEKAVEIAKKENALEGLKMCYMTLGGISYFKADYDKAIEYFYSAIKITDKNGELSVKDAGILGNIGVIYKKQGNLSKALSVQSRVLTVFESKNDSMGISTTYTNIGEIYRIQKQYDNALTSYEKSAAIKLSIDHQPGLGIVYNNMGLCFSEKGDFEKAERYLNRAYQIEKEIGNQVRITETQLDLANHYFLSKQHLKSLKNAETALASSKELGLKRNTSDLYLILSQNYEALNKSKEAHHYHKLFFKEREILLNEDVNEKIAEMDVKYETAFNKKRIAELQLEQKDAALSLARLNNQRNLFIFGFAILLMIVGFLFYQYRTKKKTSDILSTKNEQISEALAEREILLKEIHHRVKNNLQIISSLLYLQEGSLEDESAKDAVRQGQHRVKAMSLIHQRLYTADDVRGVDIQDYFEKLCDELFTAFGVDQDQVEYRIETNGLKLDIDTVIPIGLIVNELITNAIKYAFSNKKKGILTLKVRDDAGKLYVQVRDNGVGMDEGAVKNANAFGWTMMRSLSRKLKAKIDIENNDGTIVDMTVARYKLVE